MTKKQTEETLNAILSTIGDILAEGDSVKLVGFGTFETKTRPERRISVPGKEQKVVIPAGRIPVFRAGSSLKQKVEESQ